MKFLKYNCVCRLFSCWLAAAAATVFCCRGSIGSAGGCREIGSDSENSASVPASCNRAGRGSGSGKTSLGVTRSHGNSAILGVESTRHSGSGGDMWGVMRAGEML